MGADHSVIKSGPPAEVHGFHWICYNRSESDGRAGSGKSEDALQTGTFEHGAQTKTVPVAYSAGQFPLSKGPHAWKKRPRSPGLKWYKNYDSPDGLKNGRILVIDYVKHGKMVPYMDIDQNKKYLQNFSEDGF